MIPLPAILANWRVMVLAALVAFGAMQTWRLHSRTADLAVSERNNEILKGGAILAISRAKDEKARIEREQNRVTANVEAMASSLADIRAKYDRLRAAKANSGGAGKADLPGVPGSPKLAYDTAFDDRLLEALEQAELNTRQLLGWQAWYAEQRAINRGAGNGGN